MYDGTPSRVTLWANDHTSEIKGIEATVEEQTDAEVAIPQEAGLCLL